MTVRVRAIRTIRANGDLLTYEDTRMSLEIGNAVVVELGDADYEMAAAASLAGIAAAGHPVDIRGSRYEVMLAGDVERQARQILEVEAREPLPWDALSDEDQRAARERQEAAR